MKLTNTIAAVALGLSLVLSGATPALARNARGATITNSNHPDPSMPRHQHEYDLRTRRAFPDDPQCCGSIPRIDNRTCRKCGKDIEEGVRLTHDGFLERYRRVTYPRR